MNTYLWIGVVIAVISLPVMIHLEHSVSTKKGINTYIELFLIAFVIAFGYPIFILYFISCLKKDPINWPETP